VIELAISLRVAASGDELERLRSGPSRNEQWRYDMTIRSTALALAVAGLATAATVMSSAAQVLVPDGPSSSYYYGYGPGYYSYSYGPGVYFSAPSYYRPYGGYRYYYED
jgi:hypothetical protein